MSADQYGLARLKPSHAEIVAQDFIDLTRSGAALRSAEAAGDRDKAENCKAKFWRLFKMLETQLADLMHPETREIFLIAVFKATQKGGAR